MPAGRSASAVLRSLLALLLVCAQVFAAAHAVGHLGELSALARLGAGASAAQADYEGGVPDAERHASCLRPRSDQFGATGLAFGFGMVNTVHVPPESDTKERLLVAARALYLEGGFATFSLREVARRVGVSAPAVYRHYASKEALLQAVCAQGFQTFSSYLVRALAAETPRERLRASGRMYCAFATEHPQAYRVIFLGAAKGFMPAGEGPVDAATFRFLVDRVSECQRAKLVAKGDPQELATMSWAHVHGLVSLRITGHFWSFETDDAFAAFFERAVDRFIAGLAP